MGADSKIEWCDHTFNPWIGCTKVSPGCAHCYAEGESKRRGWAQWGKGKERHRTSENYWKQPIKWNREAEICKCGRCKASQLHDCEFGRYDVPYFTKMKRARVFCASLADWLDDEVPIEWLEDLLALIHATPNLDWLLLTKRPENWSERLAEVDAFESTAREADWIWHWRYDNCAPENVWFGVSVEDQQRAKERIPMLLEIPAKIRFLSCEPLLGPVYLRSIEEDDGNSLDSLTGDWGIEGRGHTGPRDQKIDWVIVGGESGPGARPCRLDWIRSITSQCRSAGVPVFVKQLGARPRFVEMLGATNALALKDRKGGDPNEWPADLRVRQFPKSGQDVRAPMEVAP